MNGEEDDNGLEMQLYLDEPLVYFIFVFFFPLFFFILLMILYI